VEKPGTTRQATDENMAHTHCMLDNHDYRHTLRICNTYCFCTETVVTRTRRSVTLCLHCLSCAFHDALSQNVDLGSVCKGADQVLSQYLSGVTEKYILTHLMIANVPRTRFETGTASYKP
jgi:hypothetical protein